MTTDADTQLKPTLVPLLCDSGGIGIGGLLCFNAIKGPTPRQR
jgi:hypothetical protein